MQTEAKLVTLVRTECTFCSHKPNEFLSLFKVISDLTSPSEDNNAIKFCLCVNDITHFCVNRIEDLAGISVSNCALYLELNDVVYMFFRHAKKTPVQRRPQLRVISRPTAALHHS